MIYFTNNSNKILKIKKVNSSLKITKSKSEIRVEIKKDLVNPFFEFPLKKRNFRTTPNTKM